MIEVLLSMLAFAALFGGFALLNRGREGGGDGGCGCGGSCHRSHERESRVRPLKRIDGVKR